MTRSIDHPRRRPGRGLILGAGNFTVNVGDFALGGIGTATVAAIVLCQVLRERDAA